MKRTILLSASLFIFMFSTTVAQYRKNDVSIKKDEVPTSIRSMHLQKYPSAFNTQWHKKDTDYLNGVETIYSVTFKMDGRVGHRAFYSVNKGYMAYVCYMNPFDLPESIQVQATEYLEDDYVKNSQLIQLEEPYVFIYRIKINNGGVLEYFYFDKYGNPLSRENLAPEIFAFI